MLGSISPVGEASRKQRWWLTATAYTLGSVLGGAAIGTLLGALGWLALSLVPADPAVRLVILAVVAVFGAAVDARVVKLGLPSWRRQVDETWLTTYRGWAYGVGFGAQLGAAVATIIPAAITYTMLAACLLSGSVPGGLLIGFAFGIVRSAPVLLTVRLRTPAQLYAATQRATAAEPIAHRLGIAGQAGAATVALAVTATRLL